MLLWLVLKCKTMHTLKSLSSLICILFQRGSRDLQTLCETLEVLLSSFTLKRVTGTWQATTRLYSSSRTPCWWVGTVLQLNSLKHTSNFEQCVKVVFKPIADTNMSFTTFLPRCKIFHADLYFLPTCSSRPSSTPRSAIHKPIWKTLIWCGTSGAWGLRACIR